MDVSLFPKVEDETLYELLKYKDRLSAALRSARICVFEVDLTRQLYTFFENSEAIFGVSGAKILADVQPFSKLPAAEYQKAVLEYFSHSDDSEAINKAFEHILNGEPISYQARMRGGNSKYIWCKIDVTPILENGKPIRMIGVISDISDMKAKTEQLEEAAKLDDFTGLYTKTLCEELIKEEFNENPLHKHALILFDLDNFKDVNDSYGHIAGDLALKSVAKSLKKIFRSTDIVGRFGGDEFLILLKDVQNQSFLNDKLKMLLKQNESRYSVTKSIGVAIYPDDADTFSTLLEKADKALYGAKLKKNSYMFFSDLEQEDKAL